MNNCQSTDLIEDNCHKYQRDMKNKMNYDVSNIYVEQKDLE